LTGCAPRITVVSVDSHKEVLMRRKRDSRDWALMVLAAILLAVLASRAADFEGLSPSGAFVSVRAQKASLFLFRDEWLGRADFPPNQARYGRASLELFDQFAVRASFDTAPECILRAVHGIGARLSATLIEFRKSHPGHVSAEELLSIPGIGPRTAGALERAFTFGPSAPPPEPIKIEL